jgi:hypothetical protein
VAESTERAEDIDTPTIEHFEALLLGDLDFQILEQRLAPFCPFESLGMVRSEVRHGNFLATLLNPFGRHGFGAFLLRRFLVQAIQSARTQHISVRLSALDVHLLDFEEADVRREWQRIDLLVLLTDQKIVIAVELKIDSTQHNNQLIRYRRIIEENWPAAEWRQMLIFLTKNQEDPEDADNWIPTSLSDIAQIFERADCCPTADGLAVKMVASYLDMLRRHHVENTELEDVAQKLWAKHRAVLEFLSDRRPNIVGDVFQEISRRSSEIVQKLNESGKIWVADHQGGNTLQFAFQDWDNLIGFKEASNWTASKRYVLFEVQRRGDEIAGQVYLGRGPGNYRDQLQQVLEPNRRWQKSTRFGADWACLEKTKLFQLGKTADINIKSVADKAITDFVSFCVDAAEHLHPFVQRALDPDGLPKGPDQSV